MPDISHHEIRDMIRRYNPRNSVILEIGANDGEDTKALMIACRNAHIHCFECDPRAIARWRCNVNGQRATLYEVALCDTIGTRMFHPSGGVPPGSRWRQYGQWDKSGSLLPFDRHHENAPWMKYLEPITVETTTLDQWASEHLDPNATIDFCWVDVQGAESLVLLGARQTLARIRFWYCECDPRPNYCNQASKQELVDLLGGFVLEREYGGYNLLFRNTVLCRP